MDDPWGSPWNTTTVERSSSPTKSIQSARSDLEPPPRAFLSASNSPRLPPASLHSPWEDSDGFGDWAGGTTPPTSGWAGWAGDATSQKQQATPKPTDEGFGFGSASPIAWPGNVVGAKHVTGTPFRERSFDPWAAEAEEPRIEQDAPRFVIDRPASPTDIRGLQENERNQEQEPPWEDNTGHGYLEVGANTSHAENDNPDVATRQDSKTAKEPDRPVLLEQSQSGHDELPRNSHSRSSSVSQQDSDHDTGRQDSPITSIDEDARSRMPLPPRKVSGKIQVLVEKFDGLAKAVEEEPTIVRRSRSLTPQVPDAQGTDISADDAADFGDFEDAADVEEERPATSAPNKPPSVEATPERALTSHSINGNSSVEQSSPTQSSPTRARRRSGTVDTVSPDVRRVATKFNNVKFDVDAARVDDLFNDVTLDQAESITIAANVPDHPITDSFTDMSERKVWYRISRQGSSRKHNFGDWDSYRRITWETSALHGDVLKIVRRWMEQDSITGRTTLGGGSTKTDIFGWDSGAEPVALEKVFAKRHRPVERPMSLQQPLQVPPISPLASAPAARKPSAGQRPLSMVGPPAAAFGWSSSPVETKQAEPQKPTPTQNSGPSANQGLQPTAKPTVTLIPIPPSASQQVEEEDDWGEMVSSPVQAPKATPLDAIFHSPTQAALPLASQTVTTGPVIATPQHAIVSASLEPALPSAPAQSQPPTGNAGAFDDLSLLDGPANPTVDPSIATDKPISPPNSPVHILSPTTAPVLQDHVKTKKLDEEDAAETERMIRQVIGNLPDLSYMLK